MTAFERIERAATDAGLIVTAGFVRPAARGGSIIISTAKVGGDRLTLDFDSAGRPKSGRRVEDGRDLGIMPASGLESRALGWIDERKVPPAEDIFDALEAAYVEADGFGTRDEYVSPRRGDTYTVSNVGEGAAIGPGAVANIATGNAVVGTQIGSIGRRSPLIPHAFEGRSDRRCDRCGLADRHPVHAGSTLRADYDPCRCTDDRSWCTSPNCRNNRPAADVAVEEYDDGQRVLVKAMGPHRPALTLTRVEAQYLRDQLVELYGPAPTDR